MSFGYNQKSTRWKKEDFFGLVDHHDGYGPKKEKTGNDSHGANWFRDISVTTDGNVRLKKRERESPDAGKYSHKRQRKNYVS